MSRRSLGVFERKLVRQAWLEWMMASKPMDRVLAEVLREHRVGSQQRQHIAQLCFDMLRFRGLFLSREASPENPRWLRELEDWIERMSTWDRPRFLQEHEQAKPRYEKDATEHFRTQHGIPEEFLPFLNNHSWDWHDFFHENLGEAPVTIRLNQQRINSQAFLEKYRQEGWTPASWVKGAFHVPERRALLQHEAYREGLFEIQDEHSQLVSLVLEPQPGEKVLDLCAGGGGKSLHLAMLMANRGELHVHDVSPKKVQNLMARARRAGLTNIRQFSEEPSGRSFDAVLVDAPCSGWGTLRRAPDQLYRFDIQKAGNLARVQWELIQKALGFLRPGGRLVYATCTARPQENIQMYRRMLALPGVESAPLEPILERVFADKSADFLTFVHRSSAFRVSEISPQDQGTLQWGPVSQTSGGLTGDGFFVSRVNWRGEG